MNDSLMGVFFILGGILLTFLLWGLPAFLLWKWKLERRIYFVNVVFGVLFLMLMYKLIAIKPREFHEFFVAAEEIMNALAAWWAWGGVLLFYALLRRFVKQDKEKENE